MSTAVGYLISCSETLPTPSSTHLDYVPWPGNAGPSSHVRDWRVYPCFESGRESSTPCRALIHTGDMRKVESRHECRMCTTEMRSTQAPSSPVSLLYRPIRGVPWPKSTPQIKNAETHEVPIAYECICPHVFADGPGHDFSIALHDRSPVLFSDLVKVRARSVRIHIRQLWQACCAFWC